MTQDGQGTITLGRIVKGGILEELSPELFLQGGTGLNMVTGEITESLVGKREVEGGPPPPD